jgi:GNAT superfamily N-acetyltransferase
MAIEVAPATPSDFEELYRIYAASIPLTAQKSRAALAELAGRSDYRTLVARDPSSGNRVLGFAICFVPAAPLPALLEYLAVDEAMRSRGVGLELFRAAAIAVRAAVADRPLLIEVESIGPPDPDQPLRARRHAFYRRVGCVQVVGLKYLLPLPGEHSPTDLMIQFSGPPRPIRRVELHAWLSTIYRDVYGQTADDPRIATMLAPLSDPVPTE